MSNGYISLERRGNDSLAVTGDDCRHLIELAGLYGWRDPEVARAFWCPSDGVEDDINTVGAEQAGRLADFLDQALDNIPDHDARRHKLRGCAWAGPNAAERGWLEEDPRRPLSPLERFSGDEKEFVRQVAAFCRGGAFRVIFEWW